MTTLQSIFNLKSFADIIVGNDSTAWCNLANSAFRASRKFNEELVKNGLPSMQTQADRLSAILAPYDLQLHSDGMHSSEVLEINSHTGKFQGADAVQANTFFKRSYRKGFAVPELV